jgi:anti-anti-sigma regulatory factor
VDGLRIDRAADGVIYLTGTVGADTAGDLDVHVMARSHGIERIVLDLRDVLSWDADGVASFLRLAEETDPAGIVLRSVPPRLGFELDLAGLRGFTIRSGAGGSERLIQLRHADRESTTDGPVR